MWNLVIRILIGVLLMVHGFAHWQITTSWGTRAFAQSGLLSGVGLADSAIAAFGTALWVIALLAFNLAGIAIIAHQGWWRAFAIVAAMVSLLVIGLYWQSSFVLGALVDIGIIGALLWAHWPSAELVGA
jgi:hypothetical protein